MKERLYFVHDPMCSWCWAFRPVWEEITRRLPKQLACRRLLGGLAPDTDMPMPSDLQATLQGIWRRIQQQVPGTRFNFEFWERCQPRRATYPACRAVIAAREQGDAFEEPMILAIQQAYYLQARNPSDDDVLVSLAGEIGLDRRGFAQALNLGSTRFALDREIALARRMGANSFPGLVLETRDGIRTISYDYLNPDLVLAQLR